VPEPQFEGQTKGKLGNREVHGIVEAIVNDKLQTFIEENPQTAKAIVRRAVEAAQLREQIRKVKELARRKSALGGGGLPGKLWDCRSREVEETEVFIVEGDSAGGSAKQGRDHRIQAILPIKGKILNVERASLDKLLGHDEIKTIISALGTGIQDDFQLDKLRYGKVIIMTDADVDGSHIRTLLLTFFYRHMPELIEAGRIFSAQPPLYRVKRKSMERYVLDDKELRSILLALGLDGTALVKLDQGERLHAEKLVELVRVLEALEEHARYVTKRGVRPRDYFAARRREDQSLPLYQVRTLADTRFLYDDVQLETYVESLSGEGEGEEATLLQPEEFPGAELKRFYWKTEFLSKRDMESTVRKLEAMGFSVEEYFRERPAKRAVREAERPRFALVNEDRETRVTSLSELLEAIRKVGQRGIDVQRYKGLGEMNPEQLWETTMNPDTRSLVRMRLVDAVKASNMFSILMGDRVEPRREFIERHALDVKYLDV
jgi:DNA gyrase subunit B